MREGTKLWDKNQEEETTSKEESGERETGNSQGVSRG